jgi:hypothetical protein
MTFLPNAERAVLDLRKLADYCLSPEHPRGRHKARVFREALGIGRSDAAWLREVLLAGAAGFEAQPLDIDRYGSRWRIDMPLSRQGRNAVIRTLWIIKVGTDVPAFVTCWVL